MIEIDQAFTSAFIDADFGLPIAHENMDYDPGEAYAEITVLQNDATALDLSRTAETDGVFQVILRYPSGSGAYAIKAKAGEIFSVFKIGKDFEYDGVTARITRNQRFPGVQEEGWYKIILTIGYRAFISR